MAEAEIRSKPPEYTPQESACGYHLVLRPDGFVLHMSASRQHMHRMRAQVFLRLVATGMGEEVAEAARLVASELVGNAVRLCGPWTPVVVQVSSRQDGVVVRVHDPAPALVPNRRPHHPDNDQCESGRGLWILDALAPGWTVTSTPVGKQITCNVPRESQS